MIHIRRAIIIGYSLEFTKYFIISSQSQALYKKTVNQGLHFQWDTTIWVIHYLEDMISKVCLFAYVKLKKKIKAPS